MAEWGPLGSRRVVQGRGCRPPGRENGCGGREGALGTACCTRGAGKYRGGSTRGRLRRGRCVKSSMNRQTGKLWRPGAGAAGNCKLITPGCAGSGGAPSHAHERGAGGEDVPQLVGRHAQHAQHVGPGIGGCRRKGQEPPGAGVHLACADRKAAGPGSDDRASRGEAQGRRQHRTGRSRAGAHPPAALLLPRCRALGRGARQGAVTRRRLPGRPCGARRPSGLLRRPLPPAPALLSGCRPRTERRQLALGAWRHCRRRRRRAASCRRASCRRVVRAGCRAPQAASGARRCRLQRRRGGGGRGATAAAAATVGMSGSHRAGTCIHPPPILLPVLATPSVLPPTRSRLTCWDAHRPSEIRPQRQRGRRAVGRAVAVSQRGGQRLAPLLRLRQQHASSAGAWGVLRQQHHCGRCEGGGRRGA